MAASYIYKPATRKGPVFLAPDDRGAPVIIGPDGTEYKGVPGNQRGGTFFNEGRYQYAFDNDVIGLKGAKLKYGNETFDLESGAQSYEGSTLGSLQPRDKGSVGAGYGGGNFPSQFAPGNFGYGAYPAYLGGMFPNPVFADFNPIKKTKFQYTDPFEFSQKYGDLSRSEVQKNSELAKSLALDQVATELEGLKTYIPAASALKRSELSLDNQFNQAQRTGQLKDIFPDLDQRFGSVRSDLEAQGRRANIYASGRAPDEITDRALELTARSRAADQSSASGFSGLAADKISDLLSAEQRLNIAQYGEGLVANNAGARTNLLNNEAALRLAPTQYSDAGAQVRVNPTVSIAGAAQQNLGQLNQLSMLSASQAFAGEVGQRQFQASQEQARREFNASGRFSESQINAGIANNFALTKFGYDVGYAGALAGAAQNDINTNTELAQQEAANQASQQAQDQAQQGNTVGAIASGIGAIGGAILGGIGLLGGGASGGYTGADAISAGGESYQPGSAYGGGEGSIFVPSGQPLPEGYRRQRRTSNGGTIAIPSGSVPGSQTGYQGGSSPGGSYNGGQSGEDFGGGNTEGSQAGSSDSSADIVPPYSSPPGSDYNPDSEDVGGGDSFAYNRMAFSKASNGNIQTFQEDTGVGVAPDEQAYLAAEGRNVLSDAGIHHAPSRTATIDIGTDNAGRQLYGDPRKMSVQNPRIGTEYVKSFTDTINPFGILSKGDQSTLQQIANVAGSAAFIDKLNTQWRNKDTKGFVNTILGAYKTPLINSITKDPRSRSGLNAAYSAYNLFQNWDRMSGGQKGLGLASLGLQAYKYTTGEDLASKPIVDATSNTPGLNVGQALGLFQAGYNVYGMVNNWSDLNNIQKVAYGTQNLNSLAQLGKQLGLLGNGTTGSAVSINASQLASAGYSAAPSYGVGAVVGDAGAAYLPGYTTVGTLSNGSKVALPTANAESVALGPSTLSQVAGATALAAGAYQVYKGWGTGGKSGAINGAIGGSAMAGGLYALGYSNPYLLAGVAAVSVLGGLIHTGKNADQVARDRVRDVYKNVGLVDKDYHITLANGSRVNLGVDGHGDQHDFTNTKEVQGKPRKLSAYDVDYTNDLDYTSALAGITLSRLLTGGKATNIEQMGGQIANAAIKDVGYNKEMSRSNFDAMARNQRAFYSQSGIKSKEDAYQLLNTAFAEHRLSAADLVSSQQAVNIIFDKNGYDTAQKLMAGRHRGIETIPQASTIGGTTVELKPSTGLPNKQFPRISSEKAPIQPTVPSGRLAASRDEVIARNKARYAFVGAH